MNNLVIDIGNSWVKMAVFNQRQLHYKIIVSEPQVLQIQELINNYKIKRSILSSVRQDTLQIEELLQSQTDYIRFSNQTELPIQNHYQSPETLGLDRLAGLMGAWALYPGQNNLVIDAGTCITYDLLSETRSYSGGSISPGLQMRFKALHNYTGKLPLVDFDPEFDDLIGQDTRQSILSGVMNGVIEEIQGIIQKYIQKYTQMRILLCGGDANFFDTRLKNSIFAPNISLEPDLVLIGLNEVIHHQHDQ